MPKRHTQSVRETFVYDWDEVPVVVDIGMVCIVLGVGETTAKRMCASGELRAFKAGDRMWRILKKDLMAYCGVAK